MKLSLSFVYSAITVISLAHSVVATEWVTSEKLQNDVKSGELMKNLNRLERIARDNGGNRAFGLPGFDASVEYVLERAKRFRTMDAWLQELPGLFNEVKSISFKVGSQDIYVYGLTYSPSTTPEGVTRELVLGPLGAAGCDVAGYSGLDVAGKIVLIDRFKCPDQTTLAGRVRPAKLAGAANVIIFNNVASLVTAGTLSKPDEAAFVPSGFINQSDGLALKARLDAGEKITAFFQQTQIVETRMTKNVCAATKSGNPQNTIILGAHLDSVQAGPGINDDGSGTSLLMELMTGLKKYALKNRVIFCWWAAEENGLVGSRYFTSALSPANRTQILAYLNYDMVSRGYYGVFDGDASDTAIPGPQGSAAIEQLYLEYFRKAGIKTTPAALDGGSDYVPFLEAGIPVGGLFTGAGPDEDPCYHQACDTYENANSTVLTHNAKAAAHVLARLAMEGEKIVTYDRRRIVHPQKVKRWEEMEVPVVKGCDHHDVI